MVDVSASAAVAVLAPTAAVVGVSASVAVVVLAPAAVVVEASVSVAVLVLAPRLWRCWYRYRQHFSNPLL